MSKEFIGDKIKRLCFKYSVDYYGQDDLRGALICGIQSLGLTQLEALKEILFILEHESDIKHEEIIKAIKEEIILK